MGIEIERKFLVNAREWNTLVKKPGKNYKQGYILNNSARTVRIRLTEDSGYITIKGISIGATRSEFEYLIPVKDANELLKSFCDSIIVKKRYKVSHAGKQWEVDEFFGDNEGLIIAEIELLTEDEVIDLPSWVTQEVTSDKRYYNAYLSEKPFKYWETI